VHIFKYFHYLHICGELTISNYRAFFTAILILSDVLSIFAAFIISTWVRIKVLGSVDIYPLISIITISTAILVILLLSFNQYKYKRNLFDVDEFISIGKAFLLTIVIITFIMFLLKASALYSRFIIILTFIIGFVLLVMFRFALREFLGNLRIEGYNSKKIFIMANAKTKKVILKKIHDNPKLGYKLSNSVQNSRCYYINRCSNSHLFVMENI